MFARSAFVAIAIGAVAWLSAAPVARAQCRLCEKPVTAPDRVGTDGTIELQIEAGLDFDRLIVMGTGAGSATLLPDGTRRVSGSIEAISGRAMVGEARVRGEPGRMVRVDLPARINLHSVSGGRIMIDQIISDLSQAPRLDSAGKLSFRFGGRIQVTGDAEGDYRGDVPITVEYL
jgi:Domain of unknown function (DUF4402)